MIAGDTELKAYEGWGPNRNYSAISVMIMTYDKQPQNYSCLPKQTYVTFAHWSAGQLHLPSRRGLDSGLLYVSSFQHTEQSSNDSMDHTLLISEGSGSRVLVEIHTVMPLGGLAWIWHTVTSTHRLWIKA